MSKGGAAKGRQERDYLWRGEWGLDVMQMPYAAPMRRLTPKSPCMAGKGTVLCVWGKHFLRPIENFKDRPHQSVQRRCTAVYITPKKLAVCLATMPYHPPHSCQHPGQNATPLRAHTHTSPPASGAVLLAESQHGYMQALREYDTDVLEGLPTERRRPRDGHGGVGARPVGALRQGVG